MTYQLNNGIVKKDKNPVILGRSLDLDETNSPLLPLILPVFLNRSGVEAPLLFWSAFRRTM